MDKDTTIFILQAIEKISEAILTGDHASREMHEINQEAGIHLFDLTKEEK